MSGKFRPNLFALLGLIAPTAVGAPVVEAWRADPADGVAAAGVMGYYAHADTASDTVTITGIRGEVIRTISRAELNALAPWMTLDSSPDGPVALAWTDSGRSLFIVLHDDESPPDAFGNDAIVRYDTARDQLTVFARADAAGSTSEHPGLSMVHFRGRLYVGTETGLLVYKAERNDTSAVFTLQTVGLGGPVRGLAVDRLSGQLFAVTDSALHRAPLTGGPLVFSSVGPVAGARGLAHTDHLGALGTGGVYILTGDGAGSRLLHVNDFQAAGLHAFAPVEYLVSGDSWRDLAATACGRLLLADGSGTLVVSDSTDTRLGFESWLVDEFEQVVGLGNGLISPDGEPGGWVIDADADAGLARFHPATPDAAGWVVLLNLVHDRLHGDTGARERVRSILTRYAGLAGDGIAPTRTADGIWHHWIDPWTGGFRPGWSDEFATLSTMKIVFAADRARMFYPTDPVIAGAADSIVGGTTNWGAYIAPFTDALYFRAAPGGGPTGGASGRFHEGIIFIEQAAAFGGMQDAYTRWLNRGLSPTASFVNGMPVSTAASGVHLPAFVSLYSALVQRAFRDSPAWEEHIRYLLASNGAWTDDAGPRFMTVFSAGTTRSDWGGYHADSLSSHPGDIATFPSLMAFSGMLGTPPAVGAYHAYRHGARQTFATGASILYRRSGVDPAYEPNSAGIPDTALGALGLAELIEPGVIDLVLAIEYGRTPCPADLAPPFGVLDLGDINAFVSAFASGGSQADLAAPFGVLDLADINAFVTAFMAGCP